MKNKKSIVDIYYLDLYQVYLVVANQYTTVKQLSKKYVYCNDEVLTIGFICKHFSCRQRNIET